MANRAAPRVPRARCGSLAPLETRAAQKYGPLADLLRSVPEAQRTCTVTFVEVEAVVGPLPACAYEVPQWWADGGPGQARTWRSAGWQVDRDGVDLEGQTVRFTRADGRARSTRR